MWLTAFPPPPPTPITLMIDDWSFGKSNSIMVGFLVLFFNFLFSGIG
jgi:hypothetical protein